MISKGQWYKSKKDGFVGVCRLIDVDKITLHVLDNNGYNIICLSKDLEPITANEGRTLISISQCEWNIEHNQRLLKQLEEQLKEIKGNKND